MGRCGHQRRDQPARELDRLLVRDDDPHLGRTRCISPIPSAPSASCGRRAGPSESCERFNTDAAYAETWERFRFSEDTATRREAYAELMDRIAADPPVLPLYRPFEAWGMRAEIDLGSRCHAYPLRARLPRRAYQRERVLTRRSRRPGRGGAIPSPVIPERRDRS